MVGFGNSDHHEDKAAEADLGHLPLLLYDATIPAVEFVLKTMRTASLRVLLRKDRVSLHCVVIQ